jgi:hypothetical protein
MSTVQSATAPSVKLPQIATSTSLWNNRIVVIGGLAVGSLVLLYLLIRRCFGETKGAQNGPPAALNAQGEKDTSPTPSAAGIVVIHQDSVFNSVAAHKLIAEKPLTINYGQNVIRAVFTYNPVSHSFEAFIDKLPLGEVIKAEIFQPFEDTSSHKHVQLKVDHTMGIYKIESIDEIASQDMGLSSCTSSPATHLSTKKPGKVSDVGLDSIATSLPEKVNSSQVMSNHNISKTLDTSLSSFGIMSIRHLDSEKNYTFENLTDKIHIVFFEILGRDAAIPNGEQRITVPFVISPTAKEKTQVSPEQIMVGWNFAYADWMRANYPQNFTGRNLSPQLELASIQDMPL